MAGNHPDITVLRPSPRPVRLPPNAPPYMREYVKTVNDWCKATQVAVQQLQKKVKELEDGQSDTS